MISRRHCLVRLAGLPPLFSAARALGAGRSPTKPRIQTVLGAIPPGELGPTLVHEHVLCDFIGAEATHRGRWDVDAVVRRMRPVLEQLKGRGITGFIDNTPAFIGRDPRILKRLAVETGLHILTNTGFYGGAGDKFVPRFAYEESASAIAARWVREAREGIEETGVKPGFIKIGVDEIQEGAGLSVIDGTLVRAAAEASRATGLAVVCHTGGGPAGLAAVRLFLSEGGVADRFIVAHADGHGVHVNEEVARLGAWVSLDAIGRRPLEQHLKLVSALVQRHAARVLISQDNGWYWVGQEGGGEVRDFNHLSDVFIPAFLGAGGTKRQVRQLLEVNPARAFTIRGND